jgi:long-chain acyl-CoA synthetase
MSLVDQPGTETLPKLLARNARQYGKRPGMREKDRGIWKTMSWRDCHDYVRDLAVGLTTLGLSRDGKLSVVGDNNPRLYLAMLAAQSLGAVAVPVYQDAIASELAFILDHAEVSIIVAEDQEQVDKILSLRERLPRLTAIVYDDPRGMTGYTDPILRRLDEIVAAGREAARRSPNLFEAELAKGKASDVAMLCYTSGTTGRPKGALLSHANMIGTAENYAKAEDVRRGDEWLSYLPMAWVGDAMYSLAAALVCGVTISTPESPETVQRDLRELAPTGLLAPPRIWESLLTQMQLKAADASPLKRRVFERFRRLAEECELLRTDGKPIPPGKSLGLKLGELLVYGPVRDQLGFRRARWAMTGGAPLGPDTFRFFRSFGVNLKQVYGATEASALVAFQRDGDVDPNTVGKPLPGLEIKIADDGELLLRGPGIFVGYFKQDEATQATKTADGWLHTGDAAIIDPRGQLAIIDRARDVGRLKDGSTFAPQFVENKLKFSPFIREAVAFGSDRDFVAAMIVIDLGTVGNWAERRGLPYTSFMDLARKPEVASLILDEVGKVNATLPDTIRVQRILLLNKELDADDNEVTRTRKVRRSHVADKYAAVVDAFYDGKRDVDVSVEITFEDGRKSVMTANIPIHDVPGAGVAGTAAAVPRHSGAPRERADGPVASSVT